MTIDITIRPSSRDDLPQIASILEHYVSNTIITFRTTPSSPEDQEKTLEECRANNLPYLVATEPSTTSEQDRVLAYCLAHPFRGAKGGYLHTAELSILTHPGTIGSGIGSRILRKLIEELRRVGKVKQLLAVMSVDEDKERAERLKAFYTSFGFVEKGRLSKVGWKFGKWIDTRYMQLEL